MKTGYFAKVRSYPKDKGYKFVSIARFIKFWNGEEFKLLAPPAEIIKIEDEELYTKLYYEKVLIRFKWLSATKGKFDRYTLDEEIEYLKNLVEKKIKEKEQAEL